MYNQRFFMPLGTVTLLSFGQLVNTYSPSFLTPSFSTTVFNFLQPVNVSFNSTFPYTVIFFNAELRNAVPPQFFQFPRHPNIIQRTAHKRILFNHLYRIRQDHLFNVGAEGKSGICYLCCSLFYFDRFCRILSWYSN